MKKEHAEMLADEMSSCAVKGCKRLPIRMVFELSSIAEIDVVMLCITHSCAYVPEGKLLSDSMLATAELPRDVLEADSH